MQFSQFKILVANYMNRNATEFDSPAGVGAVDKLGNAINQAKNFAQSLRVFERVKTKADITISQGAGGTLASAVLTGTATPVKVRSLLRATVPTADGEFIPIDIISREELFRRQQREAEKVEIELRESNIIKNPFHNYAIVQLGETLELVPWNTDLLGSSVVVTFDIAQWMADYSQDADEDFFLIEGMPWMLLKSITFLNYFLKDDERFAVTKTELKESWDAFVSWDCGIIDSSVPVGLD